MLFFTFIKGGGGHPLTGPPNLDGFSSIINSFTFYLQQILKDWTYRRIICSKSIEINVEAEYMKVTLELVGKSVVY